MGLLDKLKSLFGSDSTSQSGRSPPEDGTTRAESDIATIEHEPSAESEHAVKGTDQSPEQTETTEATPSASADVGESVTENDEQRGGVEATEDEQYDEETVETTDNGDEATAETVEDAEDSDDVEDDTAEEDSGEPLQEIKGIGPTYAERLEAAGIETVSDLASSEVSAVAEAAEATETRATDWIDRAQSY